VTATKLAVAGPSLTLADAYATAGFAMGASGIDWVRAQPGYAVYAITGGISATTVGAPRRPPR